MRGGLVPQADVYPAERRAPRELRRRRGPRVRKRAELLAHLHHTTSPYHLPEIRKKLADKAHRAGVEEHFPAPRGRQTLAVEVSLSDHYDPLWGEVERSITRSAKAHDVQTFARLQSVPGLGQLLALVLPYQIPDLARFLRVQDFVSYCRLVKCAKASGGKRVGTAGKKIGTVPWRWAFAEAAVLFLRQHQPGKAYFAKLERNHGTGKALTVLAHKLARAVYDLLTREHAFALTRFGSAAPLRGEREPAV